jgi:pentatricopeptide repeat protein
MGWQEGLALLESLPDPTVADYNSVIRACARDGQADPSCWLIEEMHELGLTPNADTYALAIEACGCEGKVDEVSRCHLGISLRRPR